MIVERKVVIKRAELENRGIMSIWWAPVIDEKSKTVLDYELIDRVMSGYN